jgi:hypothetical protein
MSDLTADTRECPFCREDVKVAATRCRHCLADIPAGSDGRARLPLVQGRRVRATSHNKAPAAAPVADFDPRPSSACNHLEIDNDGIWEYIGEDENFCYYWGPK